MKKTNKLTTALSTILFLVAFTSCVKEISSVFTASSNTSQYPTITTAQNQPGSDETIASTPQTDDNIVTSTTSISDIPTEHITESSRLPVTVPPPTSSDDIPETPVTSTTDIVKPITTTQTPETSTTPQSTSTKPSDESTFPTITTTTKPITTSPIVTTPEHTHSYGSWKTTKAATCTADGTKTRVCSCGKTETAEIPATGHRFGSWVVSVTPTTTSEGERVHICANCGINETAKIAMLPATPAEAEWIANRFIELLNDARAETNAQALITGPQITAIAGVRAQELTVYCSHYRPNGMSSATIFTEYKYGVCYDWTQVPGMEDFGVEYDPDLNSEDIACVGSAGGTAENIVNRLIQAFRTSPAHWTDLTKKEYGALGVGVEFEEKDDGTYNVYIAVLLLDRLYE